MKLCYYISDYGYGHAARSIAIIRRLLLDHPDLQLIVCSGRALAFIKQSLSEFSQQVDYRQLKADIGYLLKPNSIEPDIEALRVENRRYQQSFSRLSHEESHFLRRNDVNLVLSDISPMPFEAAARLGISSVGISNFTWYTAYQGLLEEDELAYMHQAYSLMDHFVELQGSREPEWGRKSRGSFPFICREAQPQQVAALRAQLNPGNRKQIIYVVLGMSVDMEVDRWPLWDNADQLFVVSSNMNVTRPNVVRIPADYTESQHYAAAADLIVSKPGWGTVSEAVQLNKPLLIVSREQLSEDRRMVEELTAGDWCGVVDSSLMPQLYVDDRAMERLKQQARKRSQIADNAETLNRIAAFIRNSMPSNIHAV